jgi:drug/metabolite transporter (DMT)-like permease
MVFRNNVDHYLLMTLYVTDMPYWIAFTILAASMQAVRTAGQKQLSQQLSAMSTTLVRYLFGLPIAIIYLGLLLKFNADEFILESSDNLLSMVTSNAKFMVYASAASLVQILATFCMIKTFSSRNFAVGISLAKTEAILVAILATILYQDYLSLFGWIAVIVGVLGTLVVSLSGKKLKLSLSATLYGLASGLLFAFTSLFLREASLSLNQPLVFSAAITLVVMVSLQTIMCGIYTSIKEPNQWLAVWKYKKLCSFVGLTSALGSIGWFTAMSMQNVALVKTLGQVEFLMTLAITHYYFKEKISSAELGGMMLIIASVILLII